MLVEQEMLGRHEHGEGIWWDTSSSSSSSEEDDEESSYNFSSSEGTAVSPVNERWSCSGESLLSHPSISSISTVGEDNLIKYQLRGIYPPITSQYWE